MNFVKGLKAVLGLFLLFLIIFPFSNPAQAQFSTDLGTVTGLVKWGTVELPINSGGWMNVIISLEGNTTHFQYTLPGFDVGYVFPPDTYTATGKISLYRGMMTAPLEIPLGTQTVVVTAGQTASVNFDATSVSGLVKGTLTVNGAPGSGIVQFCGPLETDPCPTNPWEDGLISIYFGNGFDIPLPAGDYRVQVFTSNGFLVGRLPITVTAGQITEGSSLQFSADFGAVSGYIKWGTMDIPLGFNGASVFLEGNTTHFSISAMGGGVPEGDGFSTGLSLPPDIYTVTAKISLYRGMMTAPLEIPLGTQTVVVTAGQTANVNFDATPFVGLVKGGLTVNGSPSNGTVQFCGPLETDPCPITPWEDGPVTAAFDKLFSVFLPPGDYRVQVSASNGIIVGRVPITVTTGQITEEPSLQFSINLGAVFGSVKWGTEDIFLGGVESSSSIFLEGNTTHYQQGLSGYNPGFVFPPDTYTATAKISLYRGMTTDPIVILLGSQTVVVTAGQTANVSFDASSVTGLVKGSLLVNGVPSSGIVQFCGPLDSDPCPTNPWQDGPISVNFWNGFSVSLLPGNYRAQVFTSNGLLVGRIPITVTVGQITDLNANTENVPQGQNVVVSLPAVEVTFPEVQTPGMMTLTTTNNPQGGNPPSQYRFLGTYYELTTTAAYSSPVTVKMFYNDADVRGNESNLKLFHWDGTSWQNITVSVDTVNNVITGVTPTLSPFAIGEPLLNVSPTVDAGGPYQVDEGSTVEISASGSDPENKLLTYAWDLDNNGSFETSGQTATFSATALDGPLTKTVAVEVIDEGGLKANAEATINIVNVAPQLGEISLPVDPQQVNTNVNAQTGFTDAGVADTHIAIWDWGDGNTSPGDINEANGVGTVTGNHSYSAAGVFSVKLKVTDDDNASKETVSPFVVIYDPSAGFVTGGGQQDNSSGKTQLGFSIKYLSGDSTPSGNVRFNSKEKDLSFASSDYQWLVVTSPKAVFKGTGTVNGSGNYTFIVSVIDGQASGGNGTDYFRMKITDNANGNVVYDNQPGAEETADPTVPLLTGSIVIH